MRENPFNANDANKNLKNITADQAQTWVRCANADYHRRRKLGGGVGMCKELAQRSANKEILKDRPYDYKRANDKT